MKVFISWSGVRAHAVAKALATWLPRVLQDVQVFLSSEDLEKGSNWPAVLADELADTRFGIVVVTPESQSSMWLNYEAGALGKDSRAARVTPLLIDLEPGDLVGPLANLNQTRATKDDVTKLVRTLNGQREYPLAEAVIRDTVDAWWQKLDDAFLAAKALDPQATTPPPRPDSDKIDELLDLTRQLLRSSEMARRAARGRSPGWPVSFGRDEFGRAVVERNLFGVPALVEQMNAQAVAESAGVGNSSPPLGPSAEDE